MDADVPVLLVRKDIASNIQNETAERPRGKARGGRAGGGEVLGAGSDAGLAATVSLGKKEDASNTQNETAEEIMGEIAGVAGCIAEV